MLPSINGKTEKTGKSFIFPKTIYSRLPEAQVLAERLDGLTVNVDADVNAGAFDVYQILGQVAEEGAQTEGAYTLRVTDHETCITAADRSGICYALTTLYQLLEEGEGRIETCEITDAPAYAHRGFLLDCSRHFFDVDTVKSMIEEAAIHKMSRLHWHLSDDQGYRIESKKHPECNSGDFYTEEEIREIVEYADLRGIAIIPEIDMPGHVTAILTAHPELSCKGEIQENANPAGYGIFSQILCAGNAETIPFMEDLLDEVCDLFPYKQVHIGGDEAPKQEWCACPKCQKKIHDLQLSNEEDLQAWFTNRIAEYLIGKGKQPICWNEALKSPDLSEKVTIQYWDEENAADPADYYCRKRLNAGYQWIYSFTPNFYFDYSPALCPMRKMARVDNRLRSGEVIADEKLSGYECALWSEQIATKEHLQEMAFPRMYALAELGWKGSLDYADFTDRCREEITAARARGIHCMDFSQADPSGPVQMQMILDEWKPKILMGRKMGVTRYIPVILNLIRQKTKDSMRPEEIKELLAELEKEE